MNRLARTLAFVVLLSVAAGSAATRPDLVVVISIDQFRHEYIERLHPYFAEGGFNRFIRHGADYTNAFYPYATTATGPGHATIGTGHPPSESGIVANQWFNRVTEKTEYCSGDDRVTISGGSADPASPVKLQSDSLGDRVLERYPSSKVIGVAIKDRAAILMAGRKATAAYWYDETISGFVSSSYYRSNPEVLKFNERVPAFIAEHKEWEPSGYIPPAELKRVVFDPLNLRDFKGAPAGMTKTFPHPIANADAFTYTPFANGLILDLASWVIDVEQLGTSDGAPDVLYVGLSPTDYLAHEFGPDSFEAADNVVRIDRYLEEFVNHIESRFAGRALVVVTADHGVQSIPEVLKARGFDAGRVDLANPGKAAKTIADLVPVRRDLELRLAKRLELKTDSKSPVSDRIVVLVMHHAVYLNWGKIADEKLDPERVKNAVRDELLAIEGVAASFTNTQLITPKKERSPLEAAMRLSFRPDRSGDVMYVLREGYIQGHSADGTNHGQPVAEDQHVPLMFWGAGITPGQHSERVSPMDIASTVGAMLGVTAGRDGAVPLSCIAP